VDDDTAGKTRPKRTPPPVPTAALEPEPEAATPEPEASPDPVPAWLCFNGQQPTVFPALGGEVAPGDVVRPGGDGVTVHLLARGDFTAADEPTPEASGDSTAN
jgi:hypothetical protein